MKTLQILYPGIGGHSSVAFSIIEGDIDKKYTHSLLGYGIEEPSINLINKTKESNIDLDYVLKSKGLDLKSYREVYRKLKLINPDAIIMHNTSVIIVIWFYYLFHKTKLISVEHQSNHAKGRLDWIYSFLILILSPKIVYLTNTYTKEMKERFKIFFPSRKVKVINNGVNTFKFKGNDTRAFNITKCNLSMIARMNSLRDHKTLIDAFSVISENFNFKLYLAGDGETRKDLEEYIAEKKIESKVIFTGNLDEQGIIDLIQNTDIYIHSSLAETFSTSLLQVMACKVPIIATDIPGINNMLENNKDALLFKSKDTDALVSNIRMLMMDGEIRSSIVETSYSKVMKNYTCKGMFNKYDKFLNESSTNNK